MSNIDRRVAVKAGLVFLAVLIPAFIVLAVSLPKSFFEDWGWLAGPGVWLIAALVAGRACGLPTERVVAAAVISGIPSGIAVVVGLHDIGPVVAVPMFALLCGHAATAVRGRGAPA